MKPENQSAYAAVEALYEAARQDAYAAIQDSYDAARDCASDHLYP